MTKREITIKTPQQIAEMRESGKILKDILDQVSAKAQPGVSTLELDLFARELFKKYNVKASFLGLYDFPATLCTSVNDEIVHCIPSKDKILKDGDLLKIDGGVQYGKMHTDSARSICVGECRDDIKTLAKVTNDALLAGISKAVAGNHVGDISAEVERVLRASGYTPVENLTGHGIGTEVHEDPNIPNEGRAGDGKQLRAGMAIAIEPIADIGNGKMKEASNGWDILTVEGTVAAHCEHTILITDSEPEILT